MNDAAVSALSETLLSESADHLDRLEALKPFLPYGVWERLCEAMEVCPVHVCDEEICKDDGQACPAGQNRRKS